MPDGGGWKTGGGDTAEALEGRLTGWLDRVPGYRGYRAKEDRRDADRLVRDRIVTELAARTGRVETIARELANKRRLTEIGPVDELARTIRHLSGRVQTASYGYGGLFSNRDVDEAALDQLRLFDESLLAGIDALDQPIATLEEALSAGGDLASAAKAASEQARLLHARLDLRERVIETGEPADRSTMLDVLRPGGPPQASPAYEIGYRDAVAILGDNFVVDARVDVVGTDRAFRLFRLDAGDPERWLYAPREQAERPAMLTKVAEPADAGETLTIGGVAFAETAAGSGEGELATGDRASGRRPVSFRLYQGREDASKRAVVLDWQNETQIYAGNEVHPGDVEVFGAASRSRP